MVYVEVGTKVNGVWKYSVLDYFVMANEAGLGTVVTKSKLAVGQKVRVKVGKTVIATKTI
jgi:hypothetical protein